MTPKNPAPTSAPTSPPGCDEFVEVAPHVDICAKCGKGASDHSALEPVEEFPELTLALLRRANVARNKHWDPEGKLTLSFRGCELGGEVGELLNVVKKLERERLGLRGSRDTLEHLGEELADVIICADLIGMAAGVDLVAAVTAKFNATSEKLGLPVKLPPAGPPL